ncbi:hypothetical protein M422DRAFT_243761 [Sphaerobolus stellatus SS14]|nr:hypothetical protein M422DRAFT_243761 [Sphaerobolus stellatus SS14]
MPAATKRPHPLATMGRSADAAPDPPPSFTQLLRAHLSRLSKLGEWEIEVKTIKDGIPQTFHIHFAALEIEYYYLTQAFDETKASIWSVTGNKASRRVLELWNKFAGAMDSTPSASNPTSTPTSPSLSPSSTLSPRPHPQNISRPQSSQTPLLSLAPDRFFVSTHVAVMLILRHQVAAYKFGCRHSIFEPPPAGFTKQAEIAIRRIVKTTPTTLALRSSIPLRTIPPSLPSPHQPHAQSQSQHPHYAPPPTYNIEMDLTLPGMDLFSDAAAAFAWDGQGSLN